VSMPRLLSAALVIAALLAAPASAQDTPSKRTLYADGPSGRYLMDGDWLFRLDAADDGVKERWQRQTGTAGWSTVAVPYAWNAGDDSALSMQGSVGWYRKDFKLPSAKAALDWIVRFESANYRTRAWINGKPLGSHKGAYLPFEFRLHSLKRGGTNRLVVRVDSTRHATDLPPSKFTTDGQPSGGWFNYGGLVREVYLRRVDSADWSTVEVTPQLSCSTCDARVRIRAVMRNHGAARAVRVSGRFGSRRVSLGTRQVPGNGSGTFETTITVPDPHLWSPLDPYLYDVELSATAGGRKVAGYGLKSGIRQVRVSDDGRLVVNGQLVSVRGVGYHEDSKDKGFAIGNDVRERLVAEAKELGATMMRTHYPPHPYLHELADREGMFLWSEIPMYQMRTEYLTREPVRAAAVRELRENITANRNHPSVIVWSIANELSSRPGPAQARYIQEAVAAVKAMDRTRPVALAVAAYPSAGCQAAYAPLDMLGINEYFGWYPGPNGQLFDRSKLSAYLDQVRRCYPDKAIMISEFGAEANREGPVEEKGTFAHQVDFVRFHLGVHDSKNWLSGSLYWALNEFRVRPAWEGGNPRPEPPFHQKGILRFDDWSRKPAWADMQQLFKAAPQFTPIG
jgi:beta-glucuronidase